MATSLTDPATIRVTPSPGFVITLIMLNLGSIWGADMFLPLMPLLTGAFDVSSVLAQSGVAAYLFGVAVSQIGFGLLGDRLGLRRAVLLGCLVHAIASVMCAVAWDLPVLLTGRFAQGVGAGSGLVLARALVGSLLEVTAAARVTATIGLVVGFSPVVAPAAAALVSHNAGWRSAFGLSLATSVLTAWMSLRWLSPGDGSDALPTRGISAFLRIASSRRFWSRCVMAVGAYSAYYSYLAVTPFLLVDIGWQSASTWPLYINLSVMFAGGSLVAKNLLGRGGDGRAAQVLRVGTGFTIAGCLVTLAGAAVPSHYTVVVLLAASSVLVFGNGFLLPVSAARVVAAFGSQFGTAAGAYSFVQMTLAAGGAAFVGAVSGTSVALLGLCMTLLVVSAAALQHFLAAGPATYSHSRH